MGIYDDLQAVTSDIMLEFKQGNVQLIQITQTGGTEDEPGVPVETAYSLNATVRGMSFKYLQDAFIVASDLEVTSAVLPNITVTKNDFISLDGVKHKIVEDLSVPATGVKCAWKFAIRRGG